jgi:hypothetical protein
MTVRESYDGKQIVSENETYVTDADGSLVLRRETVLADGTRLISDTPLATTADNPNPSAPIEDPHVAFTASASSVNVPFAHATSVSVPATDVAGGHIAVATSPPQPPRVALITGNPQPPAQQPLSGHESRYRDNRGAWTCCGITSLIMLLICVCCILPIIVVVIIFAASTWQYIEDDFWEDDYYSGDDNF